MEIKDKDELQKRIAELEAQVKKLENNLIHDQLTGLKTRAFFEQELDGYLATLGYSARRKRKESFGFKNISIIFFDLDHFKKVNDAYGHDMGDTVLHQVAEAIQLCLRAGDTAARWGGEEFIVSLLGATEEDAVAKAEEVRKTIESIIFPEAPSLKLTISAGVASFEDGQTISELVKHSDQALYIAKHGGRNKVVAYGNQR